MPDECILLLLSTSLNNVSLTLLVAIEVSIIDMAAFSCNSSSRFAVLIPLSFKNALSVRTKPGSISGSSYGSMKVMFDTREVSGILSFGAIVKPPRSVDIHFLLSSCLCKFFLVRLSLSNEAVSNNSFLVRTSFNRSYSVRGLNLVSVRC